MPQEASTKAPGLWELFFTFAKIGAMTFGGGYAMLPIIQREIVEDKHWAKDEDLTNYFAVGQCTPGVIAVNTATFIGYKAKGIVGGIAATLGVVFPSLLIICSLAGVISAFENNPYVVKAFMGVRACVCALILNAVIKLWKSAVSDRLTFSVFLVALALSLLTPLSPVVIILAIILLGIILVMTEKHRIREKGEH